MCLAAEAYKISEQIVRREANYKRELYRIIRESRKLMGKSPEEAGGKKTHHTNEERSFGPGTAPSLGWRERNDKGGLQVHT